MSQNFNAQAQTIVTNEKAVLEDMAIKYLGPSELGYKYYRKVSIDIGRRTGKIRTGV